MPGGGDPDNRRDFPGGFPGDARNAFTAAGRSAAENDIWNYVAKLGKLSQELEPLRRGKTLDLLDEEQQMAYARVTDKQAVIIVINNDTKPANVEFDLSDIKVPTRWGLIEVLNGNGPLKVINGKVGLKIAARTANIYVNAVVK